MHVIRVVPLTATVLTAPQVLDYFWASPLPPGALVKVTMGRRSVQAIVLESLDVRGAKLQLKKSSFGLKKLSSVVTESPQATEHQIAIAQWIATQYAAPLSTTLKTVLPNWLGKRGKLLSLRTTVATPAPTLVPKIIITEPTTALAHIKKSLEQSKVKTTLIILPEVSLATYVASQLSEYNPVLVHSELKPGLAITAYRATLAGDVRVIITTRVGLFLPFPNLDHIIMEDPQHEAYKSEMTPKYAAPDIARELARIYGAHLTYLTPALSTVQHYLADKGILECHDQKPHWPEVNLIAMAEEQQADNHSFLGRITQEALLDAYEDKTPMLFISARRAYTTSVRCTRCHTAVACATCEIPMRLHRTTEDMLVCYHCGSFTSVPKQCPTCTSGPLKASGTPGSQRIRETIQGHLDRYGYPKIDIPILDSDLVRTPADEKEVVQRFLDMEHPILIATQKAFSYRYQLTFPRIVVVSADALAYNPDFRSQERLIYQLEKLADFHPEHLYIQSWESQGVVTLAKGRDWGTFFTDELKARKALQWPPFTRIAKLTYRHKNRAIAVRQATLAADRLQRAAAHYKQSAGVHILGPTPALVEKTGGIWTQHIILKTTLPSATVAQLMSHLDRGWMIDLDPRSIT